jgi:hypothetical protein
MQSNRVIVLSMSELEEAIKMYVRKKYHEKLEDLTHLCDISVDDAVSFVFCKDCEPKDIKTGV